MIKYQDECNCVNLRVYMVDILQIVVIWISTPYSLVSEHGPV